MFVVFFFVVSFLVVGAACAPFAASPWRRRINQSVKQETELRVVLVATSGCALPAVGQGARLCGHEDDPEFRLLLRETELRVVLVATPGCARLLAHPDVAPAALTIQLKAWRRYSRCL